MGSKKQERAGFSLRLSQSLYAAGWKKVSPSRLAQAFNLLAGHSSVTVHAVRKWVLGDAIPTQPKIIVLAKLLNVTAEWLRFGSELEQSAPTRFDSEDSVLLADVSKLSDAHKQMARDLVKMLIRLGVVAHKSLRVTLRGDA